MLLLGVSVPFAGWWLIGDLSEDTAISELEYIVRPPAIDSRLVAVVGATALAIACLSVAAIVRAVISGGAELRWLRVGGLALVAGILTAFAARVITAGTDGANIGGGLVLLFAVPILIAFLVVIVLDYLRLRRSRES